jgi:hypothetical protein
MKLNSYWLAGIGAIVAAGVIGIGVVAGQEGTPSPSGTGTATGQETPAADETPTATDDNRDSNDEERARGFGCGVKFAAPAALASFLGITVEQLRTELSADGATLATVAEANGQSRDALKAFLTAEAETALAEKVADGDLTQAEADERLSRLTSNLDAIIDGEAGGRGLGLHGRRGFHRNFDGSDEEIPATSS